jgi:tetratricopeptide (TPR) repeat protein
MLREMGVKVQTAPPPEYSQAKSLFEAGNFEQVFDLLDPVAPGNPAALRLLSESENRRERWRYAAACLAQAIALSGAGPGEWTKLAELILRGRQFKSAARLCRIALAEDSENADALNLLGFIAIQQKDVEQAMIYLIKARLTNAQHTWVQENLAQIADALGLSLTEAIREHSQRMIAQKKYAYAAEALTLLIELEPTDVEAYKSLAVVLQGVGQPEDALIMWQAAQNLAVG